MEAFFTSVYSGINSHGEKAIDKLFPKWVTANGVTVFRGLLAFPVIFCFEFGYYCFAITFYVISGILDYVDGALARSRSQMSELGKFLDPMVDKFFIVAVGSYLVLRFLALEIVWWSIQYAVLISFASLAIMEIRLGIKRIQDFHFNQVEQVQKKDLKANIWGKVKFCSEILGTGFLLLTPFSIFFAVVSAVLFLPAFFFARKSLRGKQ